MPAKTIANFLKSSPIFASVPADEITALAAAAREARYRPREFIFSEGDAPAAFDLLKENVNDCKPSRAITVISFRGTADSRVPYDGGPSSLVPGMSLTFLGAQGTFEAWGTIDGCTGSPAPADANGCAHYGSCRDGVEVILCTKQGGREEPGDPGIAWPVLQRHTL